MRTTVGVLMACTILLLSAVNYSVADVPMIITYQGILNDISSGEPFNGLMTVGFGLYAYLNGQPEMTLLWSENNDVQFTEGYFTVILGDQDPLPDSIFGRQLYLGITIGGAELLPRRELVSGAFSIRSKFVDELSPQNVNQLFTLVQSMPDADADGYNKRSADGDDCNDMDPSIHPGAMELCDGIDNDCDGQIDDNASGLCEYPPHVEYIVCQNGECTISICEPGWVDENGVYIDGCEQNCQWVYIDSDCDGWAPWQADGLDSVCLQGYSGCYTAWPDPHFGDCAPTDPEMHPGAVELCDNIDNDCDMQVDEDVPPQFCPQDGVCAGSISYCVDGTIICDFGPNYEPNEVTCDGLDNDCDGEVDEEIPSQQCPLHYGVCAGTMTYCADGTVICDYGPYYEQIEVTCDGLDNDCDGQVDEGCPK